MLYEDRRWDDEVDGWVARRPRRPSGEPVGRCGGCARTVPTRDLRRRAGHRTWICLACLAAVDRPVVERARALAAEAVGWPGGRVSLVVTLHSDDSSVPLVRWPLVLRLYRYRRNVKAGAFDLADCRDLVDPYATMALVGRALITPECGA